MADLFAQETANSIIGRVPITFTNFEVSAIILAGQEEELEKLVLNDSLPKVANFFACSLT